MEQFVKTVSGFLWGNYMIILCLVVGVFFAIKTKFFWLRYLKESIRLVKRKTPAARKVSHRCRHSAWRLPVESVPATS